MIREALKLTTYFGERDRAGGRFLADALLELYARHDVEASMLARGTEGFGLKHHLHTDRLLTLSEDLPMVSVAVDTRERITSLAEEVARLQRTGLVTLERARLLDGVPEVTEPAKLTLYVTGGRAAYIAACAALSRHGAAGATVLLGVDGTVHGERRRATRAPAIVIAVGSAAALSGAIDELRPRLATLERIRIGELQRATDMWSKLTVHLPPGHEHRLTRELRAAGLRGATTLRGAWGFQHGHLPAGDRVFQVRRRVPVLTVVIDAADRIDRAFDVMTGHGLLTSELVPRIGPAPPG